MVLSMFRVYQRVHWWLFKAGSLHLLLWMRHSPETAVLPFFFFFFFFLAGSASSRSAACPLRITVSMLGGTGTGLGLTDTGCSCSIPFASMIHADASGETGTGALWEERRKPAESAEWVTKLQAKNKLINVN